MVTAPNGSNIINLTIGAITNVAELKGTWNFKQDTCHEICKIYNDFSETVGGKTVKGVWDSDPTLPGGFIDLCRHPPVSPCFSASLPCHTSWCKVQKDI